MSRSHHRGPYGIGGGTPQGTTGWRICGRCVMDTSDPGIQFAEDGTCNHCAAWDDWAASRPAPEARRQALDDLVAAIRRDGHRSQYDCVIGLSGGVDSTMVAWHLIQLGLRPIALHLDNGWDSETAVWNVEQTCRALQIPLISRVLEWEPYRRLQLAFLRAGVIDADIPADHAIVASLYGVAVRHRIRWIVAGTNQETEHVLPAAWVWPKTDATHLRAVARHCDPDLDVSRRWYPLVSTSQRAALSRLGVRWTCLLDLIGLDKAAAKTHMAAELGWRDYGGKHHESIWTRWYQACYLPRRFAVDKRRAHLASTVLSGQQTRGEALDELDRPVLSDELVTVDSWYVARKLGISDEELDLLIRSPGVPHTAFASERRWMEPLRPIVDRLNWKVY